MVTHATYFLPCRSRDRSQIVTAILPTRMIGRTGLFVTELGVGTAPLGNLYRQVSSDDAEATMRAALSAGVRYVDTAPYYGFGLSERRVGDAVRGASDVVISTKVGRLLSAAPEVRDATERLGFHSPMPFEPQYDYSYDGIMRSWEASLQRLGLARVDILFVHDIGRLTHRERHRATFDQLTSGGGFKALEELRPQGRGIYMLSSCQEGQQSYEDPDLGHGVFMHFVLQGLDGKATPRNDGRITMKELYDFVHENVTSYVHKKYNDPQTPVFQSPAFKGEVEGGDFDIGNKAISAPVVVTPAGRVMSFTCKTLPICISPIFTRMLSGTAVTRHSTESTWIG
jgi:hypothetical protein